MTPEDQEQIARLVKQIHSESDSVKLLVLMEELNELLGEQEAQIALLRAGKANSGSATQQET
jgi:hypothetical protein